MSKRERTAAVLLGVYKYGVSPVLHSAAGVTGACRFQPTCSEYAAIAVTEHGFLRGGLMALWRLLRCNPFSRGGFDPVPPNPRKHTHDSCGQAPGLGPRPLP